MLFTLPSAHTRLNGEAAAHQAEVCQNKFKCITILWM